MIQLKSAREIEIMKGASRSSRRSCWNSGKTVAKAQSTADLDRIAEDLIQKKKARPAFKGYRGFPACVCISINEEVVHGIPSPKRVMKHGDVVGLDFGVIYDGYYGDAAMTVPIGEIRPEVEIC